eukprot:gene1786-1907_t
MNTNFVSEVLPYDYSELVHPLQKLWEAISSLKIIFYLDEPVINDPFIVHHRITNQILTIDRLYISLIEPHCVADSPVGLRNLIHDVERDDETPPNLQTWCTDYRNQPQPSFDLIINFFQSLPNDNPEQNLPPASRLGWMDPISNARVGFRTYNPHNHQDVLVISDEIKISRRLCYHHPRFFTAVILLTCDNYAVPLHPSHGLNMALLDEVTQNDIILKIKCVFDLLMVIKILACHQYALSTPFSLHDLLYLNTQNLPTVQIRNPAIIIQGGNIQENVNNIFDIFTFGFPDLQENLFQPLIQAWHNHHNLNRLLLELEVYKTMCERPPENIQNFSLQYLLENRSIQRYLILRTLQQINFEQGGPRLRLMFTNATNLSLHGNQLSFTIEHFDLENNNINTIQLIQLHLNNDGLMNLYIIDLLTAFSCLHRAGISFSGTLLLHRTLWFVEGEIQFHLQVDDEAHFTLSPPVTDLILLSNYLKALIASFPFLFSNIQLTSQLIQDIHKLSERLVGGNFFDMYQFNYVTVWHSIRHNNPES